MCPSGLGDCHGPPNLTGQTQHFWRRVVQRYQGVTLLLLRHLRPLCGRQVRRHLQIDSLRWTQSLGRKQNHFRWGGGETAHVVLVSSCHCASPKEAPAAIAASELTQTSILYVMHLYNLLDFICIGVSHSNEKSPEMTLTIPDVAPCSPIKRAFAYLLNSQAWLYDARYSNHGATPFFFIIFVFFFFPGTDWESRRNDTMNQCSWNWSTQQVASETLNHSLALKRRRLCLAMFNYLLLHPNHGWLEIPKPPFTWTKEKIIWS